MKKFLKWSAATVGILILTMAVGLWVVARFYGAKTSAEAVAAMVPDANVAIVTGDTMVFRPKAAAPRTGMLLIPGALCDPQGYAPVLHRIAAAGFLVVVVRQPLDMAVFSTLANSDWPIEVQNQFPEIKRWVLAGHSMGASMAGQFVHDYPTAMNALIMWDGYPPESTGDLSQARIPVWHIHRATPDGKPPESFTARRKLFPANSHWVPIAGGIHMYFGSFDGGIYREQWPASISRDAQHDQLVAATVAALREVAASP